MFINFVHVLYFTSQTEFASRVHMLRMFQFCIKRCVSTRQRDSWAIACSHMTITNRTTDMLLSLNLIRPLRSFWLRRLCWHVHMLFWQPVSRADLASADVLTATFSRAPSWTSIRKRSDQRRESRSTAARHTDDLYYCAVHTVHELFRSSTCYYVIHKRNKKEKKQSACSVVCSCKKASSVSNINIVRSKPENRLVIVRLATPLLTYWTDSTIVSCRDGE